MNIEALKHALANGPNVFQPYHFDNFARFQRYASVEGKRVLVLGCSLGADCQMIHAAGAVSVVGVDLDPRIGKAYSNPAVTYLRSSVSALSGVDTDSIDVVYSIAVFEHVFDVEGALLEARRVLKPGGIAYIVSSPLWNSAYGHHLKAILEDLPWVHLCCSPSEFLKQLSERDVSKTGKSPEELVNYVFRSDEFNRFPSQFYELISNTITGVTFLSNEVQQYPMDRIQDLTFFHRALNRGYTQSELLSFSHTCAFRKQ